MNLATTVFLQRPEWPKTFYRKAKAREKKVIEDVFGPSYVDVIQHLLLDITQLYPRKSYARDSYGNIYQVVGCSMYHDKEVYVLHTENGNIYRVGVYSLFPFKFST